MTQNQKTFSFSNLNNFFCIPNINLKYSNDEDNENDENQENINTLNILDLLQYLILNPILKLIIPVNSEIYNELNIRSCGKLSIDMIKFTIDSSENRLKLLEKGKKETEIFIKNKYNISL